MRIIRRKVLNVAGTVFIAAAVLRIVFLITGLRTYAEHPEIPLRICEILATIAAALYTYFFSRKFSLPLILATCGVMLAPTVMGLTGSFQITSAHTIIQDPAAKQVFDILLIAGWLLTAVLSIICWPLIRRSKSNGTLIRTMAVLIILIFAAQLVYQLVSLVMTLAAETYPHQYSTKYYYASAVTYLAMIVTGFAYFITAAVDPSKKLKEREDDQEDTPDESAQEMH